MLSHIVDVVEATQAAHELVYRKRKLTPEDVPPASRSEARAGNRAAKTVWQQLDKVSTQRLHTDYLSYHPLLLALRNDPLRDENGNPLPPDLAGRLSREARALLMNRKLADIRRRAKEGDADKARDLKGQLNLFYRGARKNHRNVVDYVNQLLTHERYLKVVSLQTGYYPRHPSQESAQLDAMFSRERPPPKGSLGLLRRLQDHRDGLLDPKNHDTFPHLFKGLAGYVWQLRWTPEQGFYLHWWLFFTVENPLPAIEHGQWMGQLWQNHLTRQQGVVFRQASQHDRGSPRYRAYGWVDALESDRVTPQEIQAFQQTLPPPMRNACLKQRTRLDHLQAMIDAQMGTEYYLQLNRPSLLAQQGDARDQRITEELAGIKPIKSIRTQGKGQPPKGKPNEVGAVSSRQASLPAALEKWVETRGVPARRSRAQTRR
ncbi:MAG: hypothetical protein ACQEXG_14800 [Pseudomonadota bacterium]